MKKYLYLILFFLVCVPAIAGTINSYTLKSPPDDADTIVIYDSDDGSTKKIAVGDISGSGAGINWSSYPDLTTLSSAQEFLINNAGTSSSANWEVVQANIPTGGWTDSGTNLYTTTTTDTVSIGTTTSNSSLEIVEQSGVHPFMVSSAIDGRGDSFVVSSSGNVGVGTSTPKRILDVRSSGVNVARFISTSASGQGAGTADIQIVTDDGAALSSGDKFSTLQFAAASDSSHSIGSSTGITSYALSDWTGSNYHSRMDFEITSSGSNARQSRMSLANANLGIGTINPLSRLSIIGSGVSVATSVSSTFAQTSAPSAGSIFEGNVGIGTYSPVSKLEVNGLIVPDKVSADPCTAGQEGAIFYNDTSNYWCGCNGTDDVKLTDNTTACF